MTSSMLDSWQLSTVSENDANFSVICSFFYKFGVSLGVNYNIQQLKEMIEDTNNLREELIELHIKLLRKRRKYINKDKWERALVKFCAEYSNVDAWELERYGYKNSKLSIKLEILKRLLEAQFDYNPKFKLEVNANEASSLRILPIGRDINGNMYWYQNDPEYNFRIYREEADDEQSWILICQNKGQLETLIGNLESNHTIECLKEETLSLSDTNDDNSNLTKIAVNNGVNNIKKELKEELCESNVKCLNSDLLNVCENEYKNEVNIEIKSEINEEIKSELLLAVSDDDILNINESKLDLKIAPNDESVSETKLFVIESDLNCDTKCEAKVNENNSNTEFVDNNTNTQLSKHGLETTLSSDYSNKTNCKLEPNFEDICEISDNSEKTPIDETNDCIESAFINETNSDENYILVKQKVDENQIMECNEYLIECEVKEVLNYVIDEVSLKLCLEKSSKSNLLETKVTDKSTLSIEQTVSLLCDFLVDEVCRQECEANCDNAFKVIRGRGRHSKSRGRGRGRGRGRARGFVDSSVTVKKIVNHLERKKRREIDLLMDDEDSDNPLPIPEETIGKRSSRRIQALQEKKMAQLAEQLKQEQCKIELMAKKRGALMSAKDKDDSDDSSVDVSAGKKRKRNQNKSEEESDSSIDDKENKKSKRRKGSKKYGPNPWEETESSSDNSEDSEEIEENEDDDEELKFDESEDEFACEDVEPDAEPVVVRRARTVKIQRSDSEDSDEESSSESEVENDDKPCGRCGKYDNPEWILLCDKCDDGFHTACLRPPLMLIPDGDWYCPPCEHKMLCEKLNEELASLSLLLAKKEREELRKRRLKYVAISVDNILKNPKSERLLKKQENKLKNDDIANGCADYNDEDEDLDNEKEGENHDENIANEVIEDKLRRNEECDDEEEEDEENEDEEDDDDDDEDDCDNNEKALWDDDEEEDRVVYRQRKARSHRNRKTINYQFTEFDELINSAIQEEMETERGAGTGKGKDMSNITNNVEDIDFDKPYTEEEVPSKDNEIINNNVENADINNTQVKTVEEIVAQESKEDVVDEVEEECEKNEEPNMDDNNEEECLPKKKKVNPRQTKTSTKKCNERTRRRHRGLNDLNDSTEYDDDSDEDFKGDSSATEIDDASDEEFVDDEEATENEEELSEESDYKYRRSARNVSKKSKSSRKQSKKSSRKSVSSKLGKRGYRRDEFVVSSDDSDDYKASGYRTRTRAAAKKKISYREDTTDDESEEEWCYKSSKSKKYPDDESSEEEWGGKKSASKNKRFKKSWGASDEEDDDNDEDDDDNENDDDDDDEEVEEEEPVYKPGPKSSKTSGRLIMKGKPRLSKTKGLLKLKAESEDESTKSVKKNKKIKKNKIMSESEIEDEIVDKNENANVDSEHTALVDNLTNVHNNEVEKELNSDKDSINMVTDVSHLISDLSEFKAQNVSNNSVTENLIKQNSVTNITETSMMSTLPPKTVATINNALSMDNKPNLSPQQQPPPLDVNIPQMRSQPILAPILYNQTAATDSPQILAKQQNLDNNIKQNPNDDYYTLTSLDSYASRPPPLKPTTIADPYHSPASPPRILTLESNSYSHSRPAHSTLDYHNNPNAKLANMDVRLERPFINHPRMPTPFSGASNPNTTRAPHSHHPTVAHNFSPSSRPPYYSQSAPPPPPPPYYARPPPPRQDNFAAHVRAQTNAPSNASRLPMTTNVTTMPTSQSSYRPPSGPWNHTQNVSAGHYFATHHLPPAGYYPPQQAVPLAPSYPSSYPPNYGAYYPHSNASGAPNGGFMIHNLLQHPRQQQPTSDDNQAATQTATSGSQPPITNPETQPLRNNQEFATYMAQE